MKKKSRSPISSQENIHKSSLILLIVLAFFAVTIIFAGDYFTQNTQTLIATPTPQPQRNVSAVLSLLPDSTPVSPVSSTVNSTFAVELRLDPKEHKVSVVTPIVTYDPEILHIESVEINNQQFPTTIQKITSTLGKTTFSVGINLPLDNAILEPTTVATFTLKALKAGTTTISIDSKSTAYSLSAQDGPSLNVIAKRSPMFVTVQ